MLRGFGPNRLFNPEQTVNDGRLNEEKLLKSTLDSDDKHSIKKYS